MIPSCWSHFICDEFVQCLLVLSKRVGQCQLESFFLANSVQKGSGCIVLGKPGLLLKFSESVLGCNRAGLKRCQAASLLSAGRFP